MNKIYIAVVSILTFILPVVCFTVEYFTNGTALTIQSFGKWFIFSAVGLRLFLAGIRQSTKPAFTAKEIFHIENPDVLPIVRELGFANLCFGLVGIVSLFQPGWRIVSASASGLYYGIAGLQHLIKKPVGINERFALWTDLLIFAFLLLYFLESV
ncbi:MAG: hypothetical protein QM791_12295 [Ferruginibacter sp.]